MCQDAAAVSSLRAQVYVQFCGGGTCSRSDDEHLSVMPSPGPAGKLCACLDVDASLASWI